jgi:hypothetical protein
MIQKQINYSRFFKFEAKIVVIPTSLDRIGIDAYPKYSMKPTKLLEVMLYSEHANSADFGFKKDEKTGLYLKNIKKIDLEETDAQFAFISMRPPLGYFNEDTFIEWTKANMEKTRSASLQSKFNVSTNPLVEVKEGEDPDLNVEHLYKKVTASTTYRFYKNELSPWPKNKGVLIMKKETN